MGVRVALPIACVMALAAASATPAFADESRPVARPAQGEPVDALRPDEVEALRRHLPTWDAMPAEDRRRVAGVVLKLRSASPENRARLLERLRLAAASGPGGLRDLRSKLDGFTRLGSEPGERFVRMRTAVHALASAVVASLPADGGSPVYEGLTLAERGQLDGAIAALWKRRIVDAESATLDLDRPLPAGLPTAVRDDLDALRSRLRADGGRKAPEALRRQWAERWLVAVVNQSMAGFASAAHGAPGADPHLAVQGRRLRDLSPAVFDGVVAELADARTRGRTGLDTFVERHRSGSERGERAGDGLRSALLWRLLDTLEEKRPHLSGDVLARLDDLELSLLRTLEVPDEESAALRAASSFVERMRHLQRLKEERGILSGRGPGGRVFPGGGRRPPPAPPSGEADERR